MFIQCKTARPPETPILESFKNPPQMELRSKLLSFFISTRGELDNSLRDSEMVGQIACKPEIETGKVMEEIATRICSYWLNLLAST